MQTVKIKSIKKIGTAPVYNMEVDELHNFAIEGGIITHNCYDGVGYGLLSYHLKKSKIRKADNRTDHIKYRDKLIARNKGRHRRR